MPARARGVDRIDRRIVHLVGAHDPYPIKLNLVDGHVEAHQRNDHLARRGRLLGVPGDHRDHRVDRTSQAVPGNLELGLPVPEPDQEADRGFLARDLADLERHLGAGRQQPLQEVGRLDGETSQRLLEALGGALKRGHADWIARDQACSCG